MARAQLNVKTHRELAEHIARFRYDPFGFVMFAFPWGEDGSLRAKKGPEPWQEKFLKALGQHTVNNALKAEMDIETTPWRSAVASGHGIGKSALVSWIILWAMSTRPDCRGVVTAATADQLESRTWPELGKWLSLLINRDWFGLTATSIFFSAYPEDKRKNYMITAQTVSAERTEAFAGLHNEGNAIIMIKDEASGVPAKVWEVANGALTDGEAFDFNFGNPTLPDGPFFDCFTRNQGVFDEHGQLVAGFYWTMHVDSREVSHTNKTVIGQIIQLYGKDSDEAKVRVYGQFPSKSYKGFLAPHEVEDAIRRELWADNGAALIMAIDVARYGDDSTVFAFRRGRDARSIPMQSFKGLSTHEVAKRAVDLKSRFKPDLIVCESTGPGVGVIDNLRAWGHQVVEVHPGAPSGNTAFVNLRAEMWAKMRDSMVQFGLCLPEDPELYRQLTSIQYGMTGSAEQKLQIEAKKDIKSRGEPSPDKADALALTFHVNAARRTAKLQAKSERRMATMDYDVHSF